jgi:hypothetical protein
MPTARAAMNGFDDIDASDANRSRVLPAKWRPASGSDADLSLARALKNWVDDVDDRAVANGGG